MYKIGKVVIGENKTFVGGEGVFKAKRDRGSRL